MKIGDKVIARTGMRIGMWGKVADFSGVVEEFRKRGDETHGATVVDSCEEADTVLLFAWNTEGMFAERCYVVASLSECEFDTRTS